MSHQHEQRDATTFWEQHYGARDQIWSGRANPVLVEVAGQVSPGRALDVGCGEGADTIWLAAHGWSVEAIDISATALARTAQAVHAAGVGQRVRTARHDLEHQLPSGSYDLVSAQFFQSPLAFPRDRVLRDLAEKLKPGGILLVVDHGSAPPWAGHLEVEFPTVEQTRQALGLDPHRFAVERSDSPTRTVRGPEGQEAGILDNVIVARRVK